MRKVFSVDPNPLPFIIILLISYPCEEGGCLEEVHCAYFLSVESKVIHSVSTDCRGCSNCTSATATLLFLSLFLHNFHGKEKVKVDPLKGILEQGDPTRAEIKLSPEATATQCWLILPKKCNALDYQQGHLFSGGGGGGGGGGCIIDWIFHSAAEPFLLPIALREWLPERFP